MITSKSELGSLLQFSVKDIDNIVARIDCYYRVKSEAKPNGGVRIFYIPQGRLRQIQDKIKDNILCAARFPNYLHGGVKGKSVFTNVRNHCGKEAVLALDIKRFFS